MTKKLEMAIDRATETLKSFGAKRVYLFGSAAKGELHRYSDIDMAVSGLPPETFYTAWARAVRAFPGREMDLIDLDRDGLFAEHLKKHGNLKCVG